MKRTMIFLITVFAVMLYTNPCASAQESEGAAVFDAALRFTENRGQIADTRGEVRNDIRFVAEGAGARLFFTDRGVSYVFSESDPATTRTDPSIDGFAKATRRETRVHRMDLEFTGANPFPRIRFEDELPGYSNYYLAHCPDGVTHVKSYATVVYEDIYDNIDLVFMSRKGRLKYEYRVHPGGRPDDIAMRYSGASRLALLPGGAMEVHSPLGYIEEAQPYTYEQNGREVRSSYRLNDDMLSFDIGRYDHTGTLVIDPWSTYFGGSGTDDARAVATDNNGNTIITGVTESLLLPASIGAPPTATGNPADIFVAKLSDNGSPQWSTYYGGGMLDVGESCAVGESGNIYVGGTTSSSNCPVSPGAFQPAIAGEHDFILIKFSPSGTLIWSTFCGGRNDESGGSITLDQSSNVILAGGTVSSDFPVTPSAFQTKKSGPGNYADAVVAKFDANGNRIWATFFGGKSWEQAGAVASDANGNIAVSGMLNGGPYGFPVSPAAYQSTPAGGMDAFLFVLDAGGSRRWATYFGGYGDEYSQGVCFDGNGDVIFTGTTRSDNFPLTPLAYKAALSGSSDLFLTKFSASGSIVWSRLFGGTSSEHGACICADGTDIVIGGNTASIDFPVTGGVFQTSPGGGRNDGVVAKFSGTGSCSWASYCGGSLSDEVKGVRTARNGDIIFTGRTESTDFPVIMAAQVTNAGSADALLVRLDPNGGSQGANIPPTAVATASPVTGNAPLTVQFSSAGSSDPDGSIVSYKWYFGDGSESNDPNPSHVYQGAGSYTVQLIVTDNDNTTNSDNLTITVTGTSSASVHVHSQAVWRVCMNAKADRWEGRNMVELRDGANNPVPGAVVTATYSGPNSGSVSGTTSGGGTVVLVTDVAKNPSAVSVNPWCFDITNVQAPGLTYDAASSVVHACESASPKPGTAVADSPQLTVHPNPLNRQAQLIFTLPEADEVMLIVYDAVGREVATLTEASYPAGTHTAVFNAAGLPRGTYFCRMYAGKHTATRMMNVW